MFVLRNGFRIVSRPIFKKTTLYDNVDIDECEDDPDPCHADATCTNTPGSYECDCNAGFTGNGITTCDADGKLNLMLFISVHRVRLNAI